MADPAQLVSALISPVLDDMGYEIVRVQLQGGNRPVLQIMADRADGASMTVDDCADISRSVSAILDVEDPIPSAYHLEVSSPGIDRPLTRLKDFDRFAGFDAKIELAHAVNGRRKFSGRLIGTENGETVIIETEEGQIELIFNQIGKAKLILTDALIAHAQAQAAGKGRSTEGGDMGIDDLDDGTEIEADDGVDPDNQAND